MLADTFRKSASDNGKSTLLYNADQTVVTESDLKERLQQ